VPPSKGGRKVREGMGRKGRGRQAEEGKGKGEER